MRTRIVRKVSLSLGISEIKAIFAAINTAEMVTAGVIGADGGGPLARAPLRDVIHKIEQASGICRSKIKEWTLTAEGDRLPTVRYARKLSGVTA